MDFRLPQPLKYSLKKKKARRKVLREETGKLSLKNHNRNASCQTDSSESSELSGASSSKKTVKHANVEKANGNTAENFKELFPGPAKFDHLPSVDPRFIYHYCTPSRRKEINNRGRTSKANSTNLEFPLAAKVCIAEDVVEMFETQSSPVQHGNRENGSHRSIVISSSDDDSTSVSDDVFYDARDSKAGRISHSVSAQSDSSKIILDSSASEGLSSIINSTGSAKDGLDDVFRFGDKGARKELPQFRSSVLHKKFNRAVENDLAKACNSSDFYMRVKSRVLGLHQSSSILVKREQVFHSNENVYRFDESKFCGSTEYPEEDKENVSENMLKSGKLPCLNENVEQGTVIAPDSEDSSNDKCSPNRQVNINDLKGLNATRVSHNASLGNDNKSILIPDSSVSQESDSKGNDFDSQRESNSERSFVVRGPKIKKTFVISDSDESSTCETPRRTEIRVVESSGSDSSVIELQSETCDVDEEVPAIDFKRTEEIPQSEERSHSRKTLHSLENGDHINESSDLFRRVTKRALILDSSGSADKSKKPQEVGSDFQKGSEINIHFKPGFSTLSRSKHEDIKKWLNAIPCHPGTEIFSVCASESQSNSLTDSKDGEDDNISLTEMEKVLDELYGKNWGGKKKPIAKIVPKKKESQIIYERLTDSDDSSTPPLPASTPGKKKLYNHNKNVFTPQESNTVTPIQGRNIFTPLSTDRKKGGFTYHKTPKTADTKCRREKECLNSGAFSSPVLTFLSSLSVGHQSARCHPEAKYFIKNFKSKKNDLSQKLFEIFNKNVFGSKLPHDMPIIWNNRLRKTAGYCYNRRVKNSEGGFTRTSRVELSSKIVDNAARLRDTLIHELCHAATWIISEVTGGHGPSWKKWTNKAMAVFPDLPPISRCHNYDIVTKYKYQCTVCSYSIGRHSKSLDIQRKCCGLCGGTFELFLNAKNEGGKPVPRTPRTPNAFALFVKENYKVIKRTRDNLQHREVMKLLSEEFAKTKISSVQIEEEN